MNSNGFKNFFHKVNLILVDDNNVFYGILKVKSIWTNLAVRNCFEQIIKDEFGSDEKFFEDFSGNLSIAIEKLDEKIRDLGVAYSIDFEYEDYEYFNVDNIFMNFEDYIRSLNLSKEDLFQVGQCFADMVANNCSYKDDNIGESFYNWCEGGEVFYNMYDTETLTDEQKIEAKKRIKLMKIFCKYANGVTDFFLRVYNLL